VNGVKWFETTAESKVTFSSAYLTERCKTESAFWHVKNKLFALQDQAYYSYSIWSTFVNCAWFCICPHTAVTPPLLSEQMLLLRGHVTPDRPTVSHYDLLCCNMPLGGPTTSIHVMTRRPSMSKSAIAQSKQVSRPLGTMLDVNLPTRLLSSLLVVPLATWRLVSQKQPLWGMNINDRLHSKLASHPVLMFHICFSWKKIKSIAVGERCHC